MDRLTMSDLGEEYCIIPREKHRGISSIGLLQDNLPRPHRRVGSRVKSHVEAIGIRNVGLDVLSHSLGKMRKYVSCSAGGGGLESECLRPRFS